MQVNDVMQETLKYVIASVYISKMDSWLWVMYNYLKLLFFSHLKCCWFDFSGILSQGQIGLFRLRSSGVN